MENNQTRETREVELARHFADVANTFGFDHEAFFDCFCQQHRTIQQSMMRIMLRTIRRIASDDYRFDDRNRHSHNLAKKIMEALDGDMYLPMV